MTQEPEDPGQTEDFEDRVASRESGKYLPPIHRIVLPETKTQSATIRWLWAVGYPVKDISKGLGVRYQQCRNIITTEPKRAAREDMPPLKIQLAPIEDVVDTLLGDELERTHQEARKQEQKAQKRRASAERELEPVGSELDDENYHE